MQTATTTTRVQLAANIIEACDYWGKASELTIQLHQVAKRMRTSALEIIRGAYPAGADSQDVEKASALASNINLLFAASAGALLRPASASSPLQLASHREAGAYLVDGEEKVAAAILDPLEKERASCQVAGNSSAYIQYVMNVPSTHHRQLSAFVKSMALGMPEPSDGTVSRLSAAADKAAPGAPAPAGVLAASTGAKAGVARICAAVGLPVVIALESAARILSESAGREHLDGTKNHGELKSRNDAERAPKSQRPSEDGQVQARRRTSGD